MTLMNKALTIAGSDTSGGAGMEADIKTMEELGVYGMPALTCIVTMHPTTWEHSVFPLPLDLVEKQLVTAIEGVGINAMKTGMLGSAELVELVAATIDKYNLQNVVIDPVMVCKGCDLILVPDAAESIKKLLMPRCDIITPNTVEAAYLADMPEVTTVEQIKEAAEKIVAAGAKSVVIKGGERLSDNSAIDIFYDGIHRNGCAEDLSFLQPWRRLHLLGSNYRRPGKRPEHEGSGTAGKEICHCCA